MLPQPGADQVAVELDEADQDALHCVTRESQWRCNERKSFSWSACIAGARAITTKSRPASWCWLSRKDSRLIRLIRLRSAAFLTFRFAMANPSLGVPSPLARARTHKKASEDFAAFAKTSLKSSALVSRSDRGNPLGARGKRSDGQTLATLGAAGIDDQTAAAGLHARAETMGADSLDLAGLIRSFHDAAFGIG